MKMIKNILKSAWNWHLRYYASTYDNMFGKYAHNV